MPNSDPHQGRAAKKRKAIQKAGSPVELRAVVWEAIGTALDLLRDPDSTADIRLRAIHAVTQASGSYIKLVDATEVDARLDALEETLAYQSATL